MLKLNVKLKALAMAAPYMGLLEKKLLMNSFFAGQFNYYLPISLNHSCINNNRVIYLQ